MLCSMQIRLKGVVEQQKKPRARKATDPSPVHNGLITRDVMEEPEQTQTATM